MSGDEITLWSSVMIFCGVAMAFYIVYAADFDVELSVASFLTSEPLAADKTLESYFFRPGLAIESRLAAAAGF